MVKSTHTENRYAVCIGINAYAPSAGLGALCHAEDDARAVDAQLARLGFTDDNRKLLLGKSATLEAINAALEECILDRPHENDLVLFYFAGHGKPLKFSDSNDAGDDGAKGEVFLASYDFDASKIRQSRSFRSQRALGMKRLRETFFEGEGSRKRLFIFDSCYSGDFFGPRYRDDVADPVQGYIKYMLDSKSTGRLALSSCLPVQKAREDATLGHGLFTYYLLKALSGEDPDALRRDGWLTVNTLFEYIAGKLPEDQCPVLSGVQQDTFELMCYPHTAEPEQGIGETQQERRRIEKDERLRIALADHSAFLQNCLASFVGRTDELKDLEQRIQQLLPTGGYITITGQAGQGKSSIIAKPVEQRGVDQTAFHFIPLNPGPEHQVGLLRNLLARLILKYNLSDLYLASESRAALHDALLALLKEVTAKGGQEVIFIDGLDQLEEEQTGVRGLSFLPSNPPPGIVLVLGTRPNDALRPLELLKPHVTYPLPNLSRQDFDLILQHRGVSLSSVLADRFYEAMQQNALYLDLVAKELAEHDQQAPEELIQQLTENPERLFSLATDRFKRQWWLWRNLIKPILGLLLVIQEPLSKRHMRKILDVDADSLNKGLEHLGGLVIRDEQDHYSLRKSSIPNP